MDNSQLADKLKASAPGQTAEGTNSITDVAGLYRHPVSGAEIITLYDPLYGDAQSEAVIRVGFERVSDAPEGSIHYVGMVPDSPAAGTGSSDALKGVMARLNALEAENTALKADAATPAPTADTAAPVETQTVAPEATTAPVEAAPVLNGLDGSTGTDAPIDAVAAPAPVETPAEGSVTEEATEDPATEKTEDTSASA